MTDSDAVALFCLQPTSHCVHLNCLFFMLLVCIAMSNARKLDLHICEET